ncbi:MAG TPA: VOC family protein [Pseudonocardiaceae bacterium]|jgi:predicted lactoylglutathione lyase|nr:VOC family protein [Pseudonocardiaceae bacterium]
MSKTLLVNLPVHDRAKSVEFFSALGFTPDPAGQASTRVVISDACSVLLHERATFQRYTNTPVTDTDTSREVIVGVSVDERAEVDDLVDRAIAGGASDLGQAQDDGFLYMRGFRDLDGHQWSFVHMNVAAFGQA